MTFLSVDEFGVQLVKTGDLDPIYVMLNRAQLEPDTTARWCLAYWCFYHAGVASYIAAQQPKHFWAMMNRADTEKWPRGTERRHFRGRNSAASLKHLQELYPDPHGAIRHISSGRWPVPGPETPLPYTEVARRVRKWTGFGPWISFKVADMLDAVLGVPVDFTEAVPEFFDDPVKGAFFVATWELNKALPEEGDRIARAGTTAFKMAPRQERVEVVQRVVEWMRTHTVLGGLQSPTAPRPLAVQEYETILCKWKSHLNGHYPVGKDTQEILKILQNGTWGPLSEGLYRVLAS